VPRFGVRVERSRQYTRWQDATPQTWTTRRKRTGTGGGSNGFHFDVLEEG
jgi:hypothetical protein